MTEQSWTQFKRVFQSALDLPPEQRGEYLSRICPEPSLRREVESLLVSYQEAGDLMETPALHLPLDGAGIDDHDPWIGNTIGSYQVIAKIGQGGMGAVYRALRVEDQYLKQVAIKLVRTGLDGEQYLRRFKNERQIMASLDHPNIARLLDGGTTPEGLPYFVMEYIEGQRIDQYCDSQNLRTSKRLKLFRKVCSAVQYAHQHLIVHRDLKPSNILVTAEGVPKLLDFGIAKLLDPEVFLQTAELTASVVKPMTPEYASPEQVRGDPITTASDVYALGVLLYRLLTGHAPYRVTGRPVHEVAQIIAETEPVKPSLAIHRIEEDSGFNGETVTLTPELVGSLRKVRPEILRRRLSGDIDTIVMKALRKEPERRYGSVEQFSEDILRHLKGLPVLARQDTFGYRAEKFVRRHTTSVLAAGLVVLMLITGIVTTTHQARVAREQRARAERRFNDVRELANSLMLEVHDAIKDLPGATSARKLLVSRALRYLDSLSAESAGDPSLQRELATAYAKVGDVQGNPVFSNLGDVPGALDNYRKALRILTSLSAGDPKNVDITRETSGVYYRIALALDGTGDHKGALQAASDAAALNEKLAPLNDPGDQNRLAGDYNDMGLERQHRGDFSGALESYRRAITTRTAIRPANARQAVYTQMYLAADYGGAAQVFMMQQDFSHAVEYQQRTVDILKGLAEQDPENVTLRSSLGQAYEFLGPILERAGKPEEALECYRQVSAIFQKMSAADPADELSHRFLAFSYQHAGKLLIKAGHVQNGLAEIRKALAIFQSFSEKNAPHDYMLSGIAETYAGMGMGHAAQAAAPGLPAQRRLEHWLEARSWYQKSLEVWTEMRGRGALSRGDSGQPEEIAGEIVKCDAAVARLQGRTR